MKKTAYIGIVALLALTVFSIRPGMAFDDVTGSITVTPEHYFGDEDNAKFNEYRYNRDTEWGGQVGINLLRAPEDGNNRLKLHMKYESPEDAGICIESMTYGMYRFNAYYQRMGHVFAYDARSLYSGNTTGTLRINDAVQLGAETAPNAFDRANFLDTATGSASKIDLQLRRDKVGAKLEWTSLRPITIRTSFDYENRDGSRPYGGNFSFSNAVEIPEPIEYDTYNARIDAEYAGKWLYANLGYMHSTFNNTYQWVAYDNPLLLVAQPSIGRNSLPPSNSFNEVHLTLAKSLPLESRLTTNFSYGFYRQDEHLMPATTNPTIALTPLPRDSADAEVDKFLAEAVFTSRPIEKLHMKLKGRYYMHDNDTPAATFQNVRSDVSLEDPITTKYVSWISRELGAEISYEVLHRTNVGFEYEYEAESYRNGSSRKERINTFRLTGNTFALDWMDARVALEYMNRNAQYPDYTEEHAELPWMRKFYAADLDRYSASAMTGFTPLDELSLGLEYIFSLDNYGDSIFGLQDGWHHTATADIDYQPMEMLTLYAFYSYENHETRQRSRRWLDGGLGDPYVTEPATGSFSNWDLELVEEVHSVGLGSEIGLIPELLKLKLDGIFALVDGEAKYSSMVGVAGVNDNNAFEPLPFRQNDDTIWWKLCAELDYSLTKKLNLAAGYRFEDWNINDYTYDGLTYVKRDTAGDFNGIVNMNTLYRPYTVHTIYLTASYMFD